MRKRLLSISILFLMVQKIFANPLDILGYNSRNIAMGGAMTALVEGPSAAYYNPGAMLEGEERAYLEYGYFSSADNLKYSVKGDNAYIPEEEKDPILGMNRSAKDVDTIVGHNLGILSKITDNFAAGVSLHLPQNLILRERIQLPTRPYFEDYDNRPQRLEILPAVAFKPLNWFSWGVGVSVIADTTGMIVGKVPIGTGTTEQKIVDISTDLTLNWVTSLRMGVLFNTPYNLKFGLTFRDKMVLLVKTDQEIEVGIQNIFASVPMSIESTTLFTPRQIAFGSGWTPSEKIALGFDLTWFEWSDYKPPFPKIEIDFSSIIRVFPGAKLPVVLDAYNPAIKPYWDYKDTFVYHFGGEYHWNKYLCFRGGYVFEPSPVPEQTGPITILDSDTHIFSVGSGINLSDKILFDIHFQYIQLTNKKTIKNDDEFVYKDGEVELDLRRYCPSYPEFSLGGSLYAFGLTMTIKG